MDAERERERERREGRERGRERDKMQVRPEVWSDSIMKTERHSGELNLDPVKGTDMKGRGV